jgi:uncharacterized protein (DUF1501 family)
MDRFRETLFHGGPSCFSRLTRRELLRMGALGSLGLTLGDGLPLRAMSPARASGCGPAADAVIGVVLQGGLSQLESFDPKPDAPSEIRGPFGAIRTKADGVQISALWPHVARVADRMAFVRSVHHDQAAHDRACQIMPCAPLIGQALGCRGVPDLNTSARARRNELPPHVSLTDEEDGFALTGTDPFSERSHNLFGSLVSREAFNANSESQQIQERYGQNGVGRRLLLARRLVEAGVRCVTVFVGGWDMHADIHSGMRERTPLVDQALAGMVTDLAERGLLDRTLVMVTTEFGRSPRLNKDRGRDHWPGVFSVAFAGGGIKAGQAIGSSDKYAAEPRDIPVTPEDIAAIVREQIGVESNPNDEIRMTKE